MKEKYKGDIISSAFFVIVALFLIIVAIPNQIALQSLFGTSNSSVNGRTFPYFVATIMMIASGIQLIVSVINFKNVKDEHVKDKVDPVALKRIFSVIAIFIIYITMFIQIGVIPAMVVAVPAILYAVGGKKISYYLYAYGFVFLMYLLFIYVLQVRLP